MSDDYAKSAKAAELRAKALEADQDELANVQADQAKRLSDAHERADQLVARAGVQMPEREREADDALIEEARRAESAAVERYVAVDQAFAEGLAEDRTYLAARGEARVSWDDLLDPESRELIRERLDRPVRAESLNRGDWITLGVAVGFGVTAVLLDDWIDDQVKRTLGDLHDRHTDLGQGKFGETLRRWDQEGKSLAIDYDRQGIGGAYGVHRVRSAGHDLLRPISAMQQIRAGRFTGHTWENNVRQPVEALWRDAGGLPFKTADGLVGDNGALMLWMKHLTSDFCTPQSLPIPGWTFLHDVPNHTIRSWGAGSYKAGLNLRRLITTGVLSVAAVEVVIRSSVYARTYVEARREDGRGSCRLTPERRWKLDNMLLAGHGIVSAASAGKVAIRWQTDGPAALRHLNLPTIAAATRYALPVMVRYATRNSPQRIYERNERELVANWEAILSESRNEPGPVEDFAALPASGLSL